MKILITLLVFILNPAYSQVSDYIYKLGLNDKNELERVISDIPYKSEKIEVKSGKEKMILKLLSERIRKKQKYKAQIICTGIGSSSEATYNLSKSRACKDIETNEFLYSAYDFTAKESIEELEMVDAILAQVKSDESIDKSVVDTDRRKSKGTSLLEMFEAKVKASQTTEK